MWIGALLVVVFLLVNGSATSNVICYHGRTNKTVTIAAIFPFYESTVAYNYTILAINGTVSIELVEGSLVYQSINDVHNSTQTWTSVYQDCDSGSTCFDIDNIRIIINGNTAASYHACFRGQKANAAPVIKLLFVFAAIVIGCVVCGISGFMFVRCVLRRRRLDYVTISAHTSAL